MSQEDTYNKGGLIAFVFVMVFSLLFFVYISFIHPGVDLGELEKAPEGVVEQEVAPAAQEKAKAVDVSGVTEPWLPNEDMAAYGATIYKVNCAACHGETGMGDGVAATGMTPPPRNLVEGKWTKGGSSVDLYKTLANGIEGTSMTAFGHIESKDRWGMVQYIRSITKDKVNDDLEALKAFAASAK